MAVIKCKMCGGDLEITPGVTVGECEYCGTKQTLPKTNEEVIQNLFNRANNLRIKCEFDKAEQIYEKILQENDTESEAHWGVVLCKYGIEYVEDPKTFKRIPTCHRTSFDAVTADADYLAAVEHADAVQRGIYEAEARTIDEIQKNILRIVKDEKPFDVFICYKETDENGKRTVDSTIANDIYYQLTQEGLKVFYAAITLEDKLGQAYEPYIFAALNSAKAMLVIGTKPEYFTAVWVKNEWSRYLKLMKNDRSKLLIPCYKDMDAYDLPEEFAHLQAQDMSKIGFVNDLVRGIRKVTAKDEPKTTVVKETVVTGAAPNIAPLLKRAFMFLEDGDWARADEFCEQVLNLDPECAEAYLGKLMAELQARQQEDLADCAEAFNTNNNYQKAMRFADEKLKAELLDIHSRNENMRFGREYVKAVNAMSFTKTEDGFRRLAQQFEAISTYKDAVVQAKICNGKAEEIRKDGIYAKARQSMSSDNISALELAIRQFRSISGWKHADEMASTCQAKIDSIIAKKEEEAQAKKRREEKEIQRGKRRKKLTGVAILVVLLIIVFVAVYHNTILPDKVKTESEQLYLSGNVAEAVALLKKYEINDNTTKAYQHVLRGAYTSAIKLGLTDIVIPNGVTRIESSAFAGCSDLTSIIIPDSVTHIGNTAFLGCTKLTSITIPGSVAYISDYAFTGCTSLNSVTIPNSVTSIGEYAFQNCRELASITIPGSVNIIGTSAFEGCTNLKSLTISEGVTIIGGNAFKYCANLTSITIPSSVTHIGMYAFHDCLSLSSVYFKNPNGWAIGGYIHLPASALSDPAQAVECLLNNQGKWERS